MVYVDKLIYYYGDTPQCGFHARRGWCHLFADSVEELQEFADKIRLKREWFQKHPRLPHYDLTCSKRADAVRAGAQEVSREFVVDFLKRGIE